MGTVELCEKIGASKDKEIAIMSFLSIAWEWKKIFAICFASSGIFFFLGNGSIASVQILCILGTVQTEKAFPAVRYTIRISRRCKSYSPFVFAMLIGMGNLLLKKGGKNGG